MGAPRQDPAATEVVTFGCRLNTYESEVITRNAAKAGLTDAIVFNTCAVTAEAERQARQAIRKARRERPDARILVTGCAAQIDPASYAAMDEVDQVLGNEEKLQPQSFLPGSLSGEATERVRVNDIMSVTETAPHLVSGLAERARAFVQVQNGCDHRCTFCVIPYGRGNSRSVPMGEIVSQVRTLVENGYREVVLTGVDISSYGPDLPGAPTLGQMVRRLLAAVPELPRLRISSIDCIEIDEDLMRLIGEEERLMPHLHLSLQAGDDMILKRMKRRHLRDEAIALTERLRRLRPEIVFGADLIAGFPTESEAMFANTLDIVDACGLTYLHVFPYSERPGTPAARIPNRVDKSVRKDRAARLRAKGDRALQSYLRSRVGTTEQVLIERDGMGRTEGFAPVAIHGAPGDLAAVRITGVVDGKLTGADLRTPAAKPAA
ncbi:MAG: tRNA (N(6)-L-threonylcarbamoyladenosine(37)-C(2))-methylthiotransferase MtaB [Alphaproteobacteria bacterium]|nr:tRNA (N(6)-L-threonylcarbamoyladenosine(37)-C(2))-methylthiotransferase MtaB [Alphaproteobacteria bacterium]